MLDDRYKYTQVPSPLVQPGGFGNLSGMEPASAADEGPAPASGRKTSPLKIVIAVVVVIFAVNLLLSLVVGFIAVADDIFDEFFYGIEMGIDNVLDGFFYE